MARRLARNPGVAGRQHPMFGGCQAGEMDGKTREESPLTHTAWPKKMEGGYSCNQTTTNIRLARLVAV